MQNLTQKFRQSCFRETRYFLWKIENFDELQLPELNNFLNKFHTRLLVTNLCKMVFGILKICLDLELFAKMKQTWFLHTRFLYFH